MDDDLRLLRAEDVARLFQVKLSWVYDAVAGRYGQRLPVIRLGRQLRFSPADLSAWLAEQHSQASVAGISSDQDPRSWTASPLATRATRRRNDAAS